MEEFANAVVQSLTAAGFEASYMLRPGTYGGHMLIVAGTEWWLSGNDTRVYFARRAFRRRARGGFDIKKAVSLLISQLADKLEQKDADERIAETNALLEPLFVNENRPYVSRHAQVQATRDGFRLVLTDDNIDRLEELVGFLRAVGL
jgi:hypothetical protein